MVKLAFRPDADGFAFGNNFEWDNTERLALAPLAASLGPIVVSQLVPEPALAVTAMAAVAAYTALGGSIRSYGLCGGMCYAALDHWISRAILPRGAHSDNQPVRGTQEGSAVRGLLWDRLLVSLDRGDVLRKTIEWMLWLHVVPELSGGGGPWLKSQSLLQWQVLRNHIDRGDPWPIGLVGTTLSAWDQHQVLVYGYEDHGQTKTLYIYDPNEPHQHGETADTLMTLHPLSGD